MSEAVDVTWREHGSAMQSLFLALRETGELADMTLTNGVCSLRCHKLVLSAACPSFHKLLKEYTSEVVVYMGFVDSIVLEALVQFMYRGEVNIPRSQLEEFLQLSMRWQVRGIADRGFSVLPSTSAVECNQTLAEAAVTSDETSVTVVSNPLSTSASTNNGPTKPHTTSAYDNNVLSNPLSTSALPTDGSSSSGLPVRGAVTVQRRPRDKSADSSDSEEEQCLNPVVLLSTMATSSGRPAESSPVATPAKSATKKRPSKKSDRKSVSKSNDQASTSSTYQRSWQCPHCQRRYVKAANFRSHLYRLHSDTNEISRYRCTTPPRATIKRSQALASVPPQTLASEPPQSLSTEPPQSLADAPPYTLASAPSQTLAKASSTVSEPMPQSQMEVNTSAVDTAQSTVTVFTVGSSTSGTTPFPAVSEVAPTSDSSTPVITLDYSDPPTPDAVPVTSVCSNSSLQSTTRSGHSTDCGDAAISIAHTPTVPVVSSPLRPAVPTISSLPPPVTTQQPPSYVSCAVSDCGRIRHEEGNSGSVVVEFYEAGNMGGGSRGNERGGGMNKVINRGSGVGISNDERAKTDENPNNGSGDGGRRDQDRKGGRNQGRDKEIYGQVRGDRTRKNEGTNRGNCGKGRSEEITDERVVGKKTVEKNGGGNRGIWSGCNVRKRDVTGLPLYGGPVSTSTQPSGSSWSMTESRATQHVSSSDRSGVSEFQTETVKELVKSDTLLNKQEILVKQEVIEKVSFGKITVITPDIDSDSLKIEEDSLPPFLPTEPDAGNSRSDTGYKIQAPTPNTRREASETGRTPLIAEEPRGTIRVRDFRIERVQGNAHSQWNQDRRRSEAPYSGRQGRAPFHVRAGPYSADIARRGADPHRWRIRQDRDGYRWNRNQEFSRPYDERKRRS